MILCKALPDPVWRITQYGQDNYRAGTYPLSCIVELYNLVLDFKVSFLVKNSKSLKTKKFKMSIWNLPFILQQSYVNLI